MLSRRLEFLVLMIIITIWFIWFGWPSVWTASENIRIVSIFYVDETTIIQLLKQSVEEHSLRMDFGTYSHLYFNIALVPLLLLNYFTHISEQTIIVVLRLVCTVSGIVTVLITFLLARRYCGRLAAWIAAFILSFVPLNFLHWSVTSHPDVPQMVFIVCSIYFCCRLAERGESKWIFWASIFAGLSFATKYSGIFILPIIWVIGLLQNIKDDGKGTDINPARFVKFLRLLTLGIGIVGIIAWVIITPDFAAQYLSSDGSIDVSNLQLLKLTRFAALITGISLILLASIGSIWSFISRTPKIANILHIIIFSFLTFSIVFFLSSPFSFFRLNFVWGILEQSKQAYFGHWFQASKNGFLWFNILLSMQSTTLPFGTLFLAYQLIDILIFCLSMVGLLITIRDISRKGWRGLLVPECIMWLWIICYIIFLMLRVNRRMPQYLLPIIPFLIIFFAQTVSQIIKYVSIKFHKRFINILSIIILAFIVGIEFPKSLNRVAEYRSAAASREETSISVAAWQWLARNYPASTRILYDSYSYVPPFFSDAYYTWGGTIEMLEKLKPDIVVINRKISERYSDIRQANKYNEGENSFRIKFNYYKDMRKGEYGYSLVKDFGDIQIYELEANRRFKPYKRQGFP